MQQRREPEAHIDARRLLAHHGFDQQRVLRDRENMRAAGLAVPARDPRQPMGDVGDLDVERRGIEQIEPPPDNIRCQARVAGLRAPCWSFRLEARAARLLPQVSWQKQVTRWSLTMPVACMKA